MPKPANKTTHSSRQGLPGLGETQAFICKCFGISEKDLDATLQRLRSQTPEGDKHFPRNWSRVLPTRADAPGSRRREAILTIQREALYDRIRRENGQPIFSTASAFTEKVVFALLRLYEKLLPKLHLGRCASSEALWILTENVFLPTIFIHLVTVHQDGLGPEFAGSKCWYFPCKEKSKTVKSVPRILEHWSRTSALFTSYRASIRLVGKVKDESDKLAKKRDSIKKRFERWRDGGDLPTLADLHQFVQDAGTDVSWLDDPAAWKSRFTLALAAQSVADAMDNLFADIKPDASLQLTQAMDRIAGERIVCDDEKFLASPLLFFATRLWQLKLQRDGHWENIVAKCTDNLPPFPPFTSVEADDEHRRKLSRLQNTGNHLLDFIVEMSASDGIGRRHPFALDDYLFELGVSELNWLLAGKNKKAGKR